MPRLPPSIDAFERFARLADDFPDEALYRGSVAVMRSSESYLSTATQAAAKIDRHLKRDWDHRKAGEVHLSDVLMKELATSGVEIPVIPDMTLGELVIPVDGPFVLVPFTGTRDIPDPSGALVTYTLTLTVFLDIQLSLSQNEVVASLNVAHVDFSIQPPFDNPDQFPPADLTSYAKKDVELDTYREIIRQLRVWDPQINDWRKGKSMWSLSLPARLEGPTGFDMPRPFAIAFWNGVSVFLRDRTGTQLGRNARDNSHHYAVLLSVEPFKDYMKSPEHGLTYSEGNVGNDESTWKKVEPGEIRVTSGSEITARAHFQYHHFIGGSKGCNWLFCWDTRMWIGVRDDVDIQLAFASVERNNEVFVEVTPRHNYGGPDDGDIYYKNLRLLLQWFGFIKDGIRAMVRMVVNDRLAAIEQEELTVPLPEFDRPLNVASHSVSLRGGAEETLSVVVDFNL
ncbi:hypothetical protein [Schlesneria sp. DSM 10557]|uniref:hypothetical protein n=1 Tax=Schlesneria sp. DSM 10557 TaxID=3044399 RepID=UPI00359FFC75